MDSHYRDPGRRPIQVARENKGFEHYIRAYDGRLALLQVQVTDPRLLESQSIQWKRKELSVKRTSLTRILYWTWSSFESDANSPLIEELPWLEVAFKWLPSCAAMLLLFCVPQSICGEIHNNGFYDPVRERDRYYPKSARNPCENNQESSHESLSLLPKHEGLAEDQYRSLMSRYLRPRFLCVISDETPKGYEIVEGQAFEDEYVFISYTRSSFCVDERIDEAWARRDRQYLAETAIAATRQAAKRAFWIDFESSEYSGGEADDFNEDVYRICDIVRGAFSVVVITGPPFDDKPKPKLDDHQEEEPDRKAWLRTWASRLWVLPELLLAPTEKRILVYSQHRTLLARDVTFEEFTKKDLAAASCDDAYRVRQLIDHYTGSILLTPLEFVQTALDCLHARKTQVLTNADLAYALKGLLRRRPSTVLDESGFEAFASLSLANDSQKLLERLICVLPPDPDAKWFDMRDAWGMQLWDIEPNCQVAGIINDRTILLDGAFGASIRWDCLETVAFIKRDTAFRTVARAAVRISPVLFVAGVVFVATGRQVSFRSGSEPRPGSASNSAANPFLIIGGLVLAITLAIVLLAPYLLYKIYLGKFWSTQAWFLGIEGTFDDLTHLERSLFGFCENRLSWSSNTSLLSRHQFDPKTRECMPVQPEKANVRSRVDQHPLEDTKQRIFTLVDTYSLTVTQFYAYRPPTAVFVCGQEGGMQRAVLCSYDYNSQTYCKETVLRIKTLVLEKMFRADRFKFAMKR